MSTERPKPTEADRQKARGVVMMDSQDGGMVEALARAFAREREERAALLSEALLEVERLKKEIWLLRQERNDLIRALGRQ